MKFNRSSNLFLDVFYPKKCVCCNSIIDDSEELCDNCIRHIERVDDTKRCTKCGLEKADCQCKIYAYHFDSLLAPFFNTDKAKNGLYDFKFKRKMHYGIFFGREMAKSVKAQWNDRDFDVVCFVPSVWHKFLKRGFNQSRILANTLAEILNIPLAENMLRCRFGFGTQHKLGKSSRFRRAQKRYCFTDDAKKFLKDKRILLVDDIKTTGATLDECSRQLLLAGAQSVSCVTALITKSPKQ